MAKISCHILKVVWCECQATGGTEAVQLAGGAVLLTTDHLPAKENSPLKGMCSCVQGILVRLELKPLVSCNRFRRNGACDTSREPIWQRAIALSSLGYTFCSLLSSVELTEPCSYKENPISLIAAAAAETPNSRNR